MGIPEGRGKMGGSHMGKENDGTVVTIEIFISTFKYFGVKFSFSSLIP